MVLKKDNGINEQAFRTTMEWLDKHSFAVFPLPVKADGFQREVL